MPETVKEYTKSLTRITDLQRKKRESATLLEEGVFPKVICLSCTNEWVPKVQKPTKGYYTCSNCSSTQTMGYDREGKPSVGPRQPSSIKHEKKSSPGSKKKVKQEEEEKELVDRLTDSQGQSTVTFSGSSVFPELKVETKMLIFAEAYKGKKSVDDYILRAIQWMETEKKINKFIRTVDPETFASTLYALLERASLVEEKVIEIEKLKVKINKMLQIKNMVDSVTIDDQPERDFNRLFTNAQNDLENTSMLFVNEDVKQ